MQTLRSSGRKHGEVYTRPEVVDYILDSVGYKPESDLKNIRLIEPSCGTGAFALPVLQRLFESSKTFDFCFEKAVLNNLRFVEIDDGTIKVLLDKITRSFPILEKLDDRFWNQVIVNADFLITNISSNFDIVVGNPPYIRNELIPEEKRNIYQQKYQTFRHRSDLYIPFYERGLDLLSQNGKLAFICSNRWLKNQYGSNLRGLIAERYSLDMILNLEKSSPFDEDVIAYPCITLISNRKSSGHLNFYDYKAKKFNRTSLKEKFSKIQSPSDKSWDNIFYTHSDEIANKLSKIEDQGFKIGIGVASGADKIFIRKDFEEIIEKERLIPIVRTANLRGLEIEWDNSYILNPYNNEGKLFELDKFPLAKKYLLENEEKLKQRYVAKKRPDQWYKTIDKISPELVSKPKLLLPDISNNTKFLVDNGKYYPHHNIYYITCDNKDDLILLAAVFMSDFMRKQVLDMGINMNGGLPRYQSQTLRKLQSPIIKDFSDTQREILKSCYEKNNLDGINQVIKSYIAF